MTERERLIFIAGRMYQDPDVEDAERTTIMEILSDHQRMSDVDLKLALSQVRGVWRYEN